MPKPDRRPRPGGCDHSSEGRRADQRGQIESCSIAVRMKRVRRPSEVMGDLLDIERQEAALVWRAMDERLPVEHRKECSPQAILRCGLITAPRVERARIVTGNELAAEMKIVHSREGPPSQSAESLIEPSLLRFPPL